MEEKREVPRKNYYILLLLSIVSIGILFYLVSWYQNSQQSKPGFSIISSVVSEVKADELSNYLLDNPNIVIYFASSKNEENKSFEKDLKKYLLKEEIHNEFIYLDTSEVEDNSFYNNFVNQYYDNNLKNKNISLDHFPNMVIVKDGKAVDVLIKNNSTISVDEVTDFLEKNEVVVK